MAKILCLETATTNCSVALSVNGSVTAFREDKTPGYSHSEKLHLFIEEVLAEATIDKDELDAIAVSKGPGSYTGLRIGVSSAKGLCYALDIPLIAIETLDVLASVVNDPLVTTIPILDARRMEVYSAVYHSITKIRETKAEILTENSFTSYLDKGKVIFIGDAIKKFKPLCTHPNASFIEDLPSSINMTSLAEKKYKKNDIEDVAYFEPYYLKDFIGG